MKFIKEKRTRSH